MYKELEWAFNNYILECKLIINENKKHVLPPSIVKNVLIPNKIGIIPHISTLLPSRFYNESLINVHTEDELTLRFIPYLENTTHLDVQHFNDTTIYDLSYNQNNEILSRLLENSSTVEVAELLNIEPEYFTKQCAKMNMYECSYDSLFNEMRKYFCARCLIFGCKIHTIRTKTCFDYESEVKCYCKDINNPAQTTLNSNLIIIEKDKIKENLKMFNNDKCLTSFNLFLKYNITISCRDLGKKMPLYKKILRSMYSITNSNKLPEVCDHTGKCYQNARCICFTNGTGCDSKCLCTFCNYMFYGCKCKNSCTKRCSCSKINKTCDEHCECHCDSKNMSSCEWYIPLIYKSTYIYKSAKKGLGCFAGENIKKNEFVIEYVGEIISNDEGNRRANFYDANGLSYIFEYTDKHCLDAFLVGNNSRFINHSTNQNLYIKKLWMKRALRICFYAARNIKLGEELFFNYNYSDEYKKKFNLID